MREGTTKSTTDQLGKKSEKEPQKRSTGVYVRLSEAEKKKLKAISQQVGISVSQLLRSGALDNLHRLPRFRKLPVEVMAELAKLDRLTTALLYLSQRAESDALYAQDIREMMYGVGEVIGEVKRFCADNKTDWGTIQQLDALIDALQHADDTAVKMPDLTKILQSIRAGY
ncbi:hypothetical protein J2I47_21780 [Fibrella sp. HMF5335]|uniref:Uncharacterized protein n=1 Tax=Fibrella rubiginis TaxID=2817060 RepID=A0A939GLY3_9BACT|nr:hypothetical protein [Fibrella rubiginis]MBO0939201.1 hypothetical protein [Fibrella rubiginis]